MVISLLVVIVDFGLDGCWGYGWLLRLVLVCVVWCGLFCVGVVKWCLVCCYCLWVCLLLCR